MSAELGRVLIRVMGPLVLGGPGRESSWSWGSKASTKEQAEEDSGVPESELMLREESGAGYVHLGAHCGWGIGKQDIMMIRTWTSKRISHCGIFLTTPHGILCSIFLKISLQMILCECKNRLKWNSSLIPFLLSCALRHFCHFLSWDSFIFVN